MLQDPATWPAGFFSNTAQCFFPDNVVFPQGSESTGCAHQTASPTANPAESPTGSPTATPPATTLDPATGSAGTDCEEAAAPVGLLIMVFLLLALFLIVLVLLWRERDILGYPWPWKVGGDNNPYDKPYVANPSANIDTTA